MGNVLQNCGIPNEYTPCEEHMGHVIAVKDGWYYAFKDGRRIHTSGCTRTGVRRAIEDLAS